MKAVPSDGFAPLAGAPEPPEKAAPLHDGRHMRNRRMGKCVRLKGPAVPFLTQLSLSPL